MKHRNGFTLIEVVVAAALLGIVGLAIVAFLSAFAHGATARTRVSDPAIEGALAIERLHALAPQLRCVLASRDDMAALWLSDAVPSRSVHLSELGWIRFDADHGEVLLERVDSAALDADRLLESEFEHDADFLAVRLDAFRAGILKESVLAEGLDHGSFIALRRGDGVELQLEAAQTSARLALSPALQEEPLR